MADEALANAVREHLSRFNMTCPLCHGLQVAFCGLYPAAAAPGGSLIVAPTQQVKLQGMMLARIACMTCSLVRDFAWPPAKPAVLQDHD